jgi:F0F1-type ATP synthase epsilon subunit
MATLKVEIVSPEALLWEGEASALVAKSSVGDFTILPQHTPTVGDLLPGLVRVGTSEGEITFDQAGGYFQVGPEGTEGVTLATVLVGIAERYSGTGGSKFHFNAREAGVVLTPEEIARSAAHANHKQESHWEQDAKK